MFRNWQLGQARARRPLRTRMLALFLLGALLLPLLVACAGRGDRVTLEGTLIAGDEGVWLAERTLVAIKDAAIGGDPP